MRSNYGIAAMAVFLIAVSGILWYFLTTGPEGGQGTGTGTGTKTGARRAGGHTEDLAAKWQPAKKIRPPDVPVTGELSYLSTVTGTVKSMIDGKPVKEFEIGSIPVPEAEDGAWSPEKELDFKQVLSRIQWVKQQNEEGHFSREQIASNVPVLVVARAKGYSPEYVEIPGIGPKEIHDGIEISLPPGAYLRGEVSNRAGMPIKGASILVGPHTEEQPAVLSDSSGRFFITILTENDRELQVSHPDYYPRSIPFSFVPEENIEVRVVLEQGGVLEGNIRENGVPLPGYEVVLLNYTPSEATKAIVPSELEGISSPDGFYTMRKVPRGAATIRLMPKSDGPTWPSAWMMQDATIEEGMVTVMNFDFPLTTSVGRLSWWTDNLPRRLRFRLRSTMLSGRAPGAASRTLTDVTVSRTWPPVRA